MKLLDRINENIKGDSTIDILIVGRQTYLQLMGEINKESESDITDKGAEEFLGMTIAVNLNKEEGFVLAKKVF